VDRRPRGDDGRSRCAAAQHPDPGVHLGCELFGQVGEPSLDRGFVPAWRWVVQPQQLPGLQELDHASRSGSPLERGDGTNITFLDRCRGAQPGQQNRDGSGGAVPQVPIPFLHAGFVNELVDQGLGLVGQRGQGG
jgi:hypothetical protein